MKKTTFYKIGALTLALSGFGLFTAFDDADNMTDQQKIDQLVDQMTNEFLAEQDSLCRIQALAAAQVEWNQMQQAMNEGGSDEPSTGGGYRGGTSGSSGSSDGGDEPTTGSGSTSDPKTGKSGKMSGDGTTNDAATNDKKGKMDRNDDAKSSGTSDVTTDKKKKMGGK